jgi:hypothetical protein
MVSNDEKQAQRKLSNGIHYSNVKHTRELYLRLSMRRTGCEGIKMNKVKTLQRKLRNNN